MSTELALRNHDLEEPSAFAMRPRSLDEAMKFAQMMADSDLVPRDYKGKPGNILVAIQMGHELGMTPMRAVRNIAVINGRPSMWGDEVLALVLASPVCEYVNESESTDKEGVCRVKRKGSPEHVATFSLEDAKRAGLLSKQGPWQTHTKRMLTLRARGFALRDKFADVLAGLITAEEAMDMPQDSTPVVEAQSVETPSLKDKLKQQVIEAKPTPQPAEKPAAPSPSQPSDDGLVTVEGRIGDWTPQAGDKPGQFVLSTVDSDITIGYWRADLVAGITDGHDLARCTYQKKVSKKGKAYNDLVKPIEWIDGQEEETP